MITYAKRHNTLQDVLNAIGKCASEIHDQDCSGEEFDKLCAHINRLIEKVIFRCFGRVRDARKLMENEGLEEYFDLYIELTLQV